MSQKQTLFGVVSALAACISSFASPPAALASEGSRVRPAIDVSGTYTTTVTFDVITVAESTAGGYWADSVYHMVISFYDLGASEYGLAISGTGTFTSRAGNSPNGTGSIEAGVTGTVAGGGWLVMTGPSLPTGSGHLGTFDMECDVSGDCTGDGFDFILQIFGGYDFVSLEAVAIAYSTCDGRVAVQQMAEPELVGDIVGGPATCTVALREVFDGLYAFISPGYSAPDGVDVGDISPRDVCYIISSQGVPSGARVAAICDRQWPGGPRPGWSSGAVLLASGPVYDNGSAKGYWEGDPVVDALSPNAARLPLFRANDAWSNLFKENCHHLSRIGEPLDGCG